ncbi:MAG: uridine kinase [Christensenellaceae bacterium]|nr:uridine kinase [Christensenellaceae bacterium]
MLVIGICGASGSGKTTLSQELKASLKEENCSATIINQDTYYYDFPEKSFEERAQLNYDQPAIFNHDALYEDVKTLLSGKSIERKNYDFSEYRAIPPIDIITPTEVLIIEGIHVFYDIRLMELMFLKLYVSVEPDICLLRRINRDIKERKRSIDSITRQYLNTVKPMYDRYIRNYVNCADVIVSRGGKNARIVEVLTGYLRSVMTKKED